VTPALRQREILVVADLSQVIPQGLEPLMPVFESEMKAKRTELNEDEVGTVIQQKSGCPAVSSGVTMLSPHEKQHRQDGRSLQVPSTQPEIHRRPFVEPAHG
jgi:hypothetical protein